MSYHSSPRQSQGLELITNPTSVLGCIYRLVSQWICQCFEIAFWVKICNSYGTTLWIITYKITTTIDVNDILQYMKLATYLCLYCVAICWDMTNLAYWEITIIMPLTGACVFSNSVLTIISDISTLKLLGTCRTISVHISNDCRFHRTELFYSAFSWFIHSIFTWSSI